MLAERAPGGQRSMLHPHLASPMSGAVAVNRISPGDRRGHGGDGVGRDRGVVVAARMRRRRSIRPRAAAWAAAPRRRSGRTSCRGRWPHARAPSPVRSARPQRPTQTRPRAPKCAGGNGDARDRVCSKVAVRASSSHAARALSGAASRGQLDGGGDAALRDSARAGSGRCRHTASTTVRGRSQARHPRPSFRRDRRRYRSRWTRSLPSVTCA